MDLLNPQDADIDDYNAKRIRHTNLLLELRDKIEAYENEFMKRSAIFAKDNKTWTEKKRESKRQDLNNRKQNCKEWRQMYKQCLRRIEPKLRTFAPDIYDSESL
jgi:hypothetical protein